MGGAVSSGRDNDEIVDNLIDAGYIVSKNVEEVFRAVDRGAYYTESCRRFAYQDGAWKEGHLHLSAPCIYSKVLEALDLRPGLSFINLGSGTGYLNTMVGLIIGDHTPNHGIEYHQDVIQYAEEKLREFKSNSTSVDQFEFANPVWVQGNCLQISPESMRRYDRLYCGAGCPEEVISYMKEMIHVGGIGVVPCGEQLIKIERVSETQWTEESVLSVAFATMLPASPEDQLVNLPELNTPSLRTLCRSVIRTRIRDTVKQQVGPFHPLDPKKKEHSALKPWHMRRIVPSGNGLQRLEDDERAVSSDDEQTDDEQTDDDMNGKEIAEMAELPPQPMKTDRLMSEGGDSGVVLGTSVSSSVIADDSGTSREEQIRHSPQLSPDDAMDSSLLPDKGESSSSSDDSEPDGEATLPIIPLGASRDGPDEAGPDETGPDEAGPDAAGPSNEPGRCMVVQYEDSSTDEDSEGQAERRFQRRRQGLESLISVFQNNPAELPPQTETEVIEHKERQQHRDNYQRVFAQRMHEGIQTLSLPPSLKSYLEFHRNTEY